MRVLNEVFLEHLHDLPAFVQELTRVLKPGGVFAFDTLTRSWKSNFITILVGQSAMVGLVPPHTHDYRLYTTPEEMTELLANGGIATKEFVGLTPVFTWSELWKNGVGSVITAWEKGGPIEISYLGFAVKHQKK